MRMVEPSGAYLAALSRILNKACSSNTASTSSIGRLLAMSSSTWWCARILAARRSADDLAEIVGGGVGHERARFELGHVEQVGDEAVEAFGFLDDGADKLQ